jgi:hypothetical protein
MQVEYVFYTCLQHHHHNNDIIYHLIKAIIRIYLLIKEKQLSKITIQLLEIAYNAKPL